MVNKKIKKKRQSTFLRQVFLVLGVSLIVWLIKGDSQPQKVFISQEQSIAIREKIANKWLNYVNDIVNQTQDAAAIKVRTFLFNNCNLGLPEQDSIRILQLEGAQLQAPFALVVLLEEDQYKGRFWQIQYQNNQGAAIFIAYPQWPKMLIIREDIPLSPLWAGLLLLHEANHAKDSIDPQISKLPMSTQERITHELIHRQLMIY